MILLCSAWCCVVTHSIQPLCALMICDCTLSSQSFIISSDFFHDEAKVLPLCTYLTIVIKTLTDLVLTHLWFFFSFVFLCGCTCQLCVLGRGLENLMRGERSFCRSPPPSLVPLHCALILLHFHPPAPGFVLPKTATFLTLCHCRRHF